MAWWVRFLEIWLLALLASSVVGFFSFANVYGVFLSVVTIAVTAGVFMRKRWGYFAAAAWGLGCYQLAKQGYEFTDYKRAVMVMGFVVVAVAIVLHEKIARKPLPPTDQDQS